jgi:hypothetical protein
MNRGSMGVVLSIALLAHVAMAQPPAGGGDDGFPARWRVTSWVRL